MEELNQKFGQIIIGPPGSGKTTYISAMKNFYNTFNRPILLINLDPANDCKSVDIFDIDIRNLISHKDVASTFHLGPNSSFIYCFNFLSENFDWLKSRINNSNKNYILIDTPGQIEIFTSCPSFKTIINKLTNLNEMNIHLTCVNLIESLNISDMSRYLFSVFSVLNAMINLELPQINLISKADLLCNLKKEFTDTNSNDIFDLSFFKNPYDNPQLKLYLDSLNINPKFKSLNKKVADFISDYSLVSFSLLDINNPKHLNRSSYLADKSNGYLYYQQYKGDETNFDARCVIAENNFENEDEDDEQYQI